MLPAGLRNRPYRFWYFVVVTAAVLAGLWMILQTSPFVIWLAGSVAYLINQGIGCIQIMLINNRGCIRSSTSASSAWPLLLAVGPDGRRRDLAVRGGLAEIVRRWQTG